MFSKKQLVKFTAYFLAILIFLQPIAGIIALADSDNIGSDIPMISVGTPSSLTPPAGTPTSIPDAPSAGSAVYSDVVTYSSDTLQNNSYINIKDYSVVRVSTQKSIAKNEPVTWGTNSVAFPPNFDRLEMRFELEDIDTVVDKAIVDYFNAYPSSNEIKLPLAPLPDGLKWVNLLPFDIYWGVVRPC